jgi:anti-anti-sigma factor
MFDGIMCETNTVRLVLRGCLDGQSAPDMLEGMEAVVQLNRSDVVLDLASVSQLDGSAIGAFSFLYRRLGAQGRSLTVEGACGQPLRLLRDLGIDAILGIAPPPAPRRAAAAHIGLALAR